MKSTIVFLVVTLAFASAFPSLLVEDEEGQQYHLTPILNRQRRDAPQGEGEGFANKGVQSRQAVFVNPNGSGGSIGYAHANGYRHDISVDPKFPIWSNKNRYGESTLSLGGGWGGTYKNDKRLGLNFNHRF